MADETLGRATLFMKKVDGSVTSDDFYEDRYESPWHAAGRVRDSVDGDFPGAIFGIGQNDRSRELMAAENMRMLGLHDMVEGPPALVSVRSGDG